VYFVNCKTINIVDGDTVDVMIDLGFNIVINQRLRLNGINTPEMHDKNPEKREAAQRAKKYLEDILLGKNCILVTYKQEKYGRYLADVYLENSDKTLFNVNETLMDLGLAEHYEV